MNVTTDAMRFVRSAPLGLPALILLALAIAAFIVWLAVGTRNPDVVDVLKWIAAGVIGVVGIAYAASWEEIVIDPASGRVTDRSGLLGWSTEKQSAFSDFANVLVERTSVTKMEHNAKPAIRQALSDGPSSGHSFALKLRGAAREVILPMTQQDDPLTLEASARQIARLGAWTAKRRGYALAASSGVPADRPRDSTDDTGRLPGLKKMLGLARPAAPAGEPGPSIIQIIASDAESLIDE